MPRSFFFYNPKSHKMETASSSPSTLAISNFHRHYQSYSQSQILCIHRHGAEGLHEEAGSVPKDRGEGEPRKPSRGRSTPTPAPKKVIIATRSLSMVEMGPLSEGRAMKGMKVIGEVKPMPENGTGSRITVFVGLRLMSKKEKDDGALCCVKVVNRHDVYLTEFASENDYLRLERVRVKHFCCFDASFPDSTLQHRVYFTTKGASFEEVVLSHGRTLGSSW